MKQCENGHFFDEERHETCPYCSPAAQPGRTVGLDDVGKTLPLHTGDATPKAELGKTVALIKKEIGIHPAVGFVVCVSGPQKGSDFKLCAGRNFVGRGSAMDVSLSDDETVSRENHCLIAYDSKTNAFTLVPGQSRGITYLNGSPIELAVELKAYDRIEVGQSGLLFLPLCGDHFRWNEA